MIFYVRTPTFIWDTINKKILNEPIDSLSVRNILFSYNEFLERSRRRCQLSDFLLTNKFQLSDFYELNKNRNIIFFTKDGNEVDINDSKIRVLVLD